MTPNGGVTVLGRIDERLDLARRVAICFIDRRVPELVVQVRARRSLKAASSRNPRTVRLREVCIDDDVRRVTPKRKGPPAPCGADGPMPLWPSRLAGLLSDQKVNLAESPIVRPFKYSTMR